MFVEFAVNDRWRQPYSIAIDWKASSAHLDELPSCDIIFVYTLTAGNVKELQDGKMQRSASVMEEIADYYQIPSIHMGVEIVALEKQGKLLMKASNEGMTRVSGKELNLSADNYVNAEGKIPFANDGVHPYDNTGHALYMDAIKRSLPAIKSAGKPGPKANLPKPMVPDCFENVITIPFGNPTVKLEGPCQKLPKDDPTTRHFLNRADEFFVFEPGAKITFKYKGLRAAIYNILGPQGGIIEIKHNGEISREARMFDPYCTYHRLATVGLPNAKDQVNEITITVLDKNFDKKAILFTITSPTSTKSRQVRKLRLFAGCISSRGNSSLVNRYPPMHSLSICSVMRYLRPSARLSVDHAPIYLGSHLASPSC